MIVFIFDIIFMTYDLTIAYRIYPWVSKKPLFYSEDKLKLSELWIKSLKLWLWSLNAKIYVLLDNCPSAYENLFLKYFDKKNLEFIKYNWVWNLNTFKQQINILLKQNESEYIYFAEDDYLYLPNCFEVWLWAIKDKRVDFVSLYDHSDNYILPFQKIKSNINVLSGHHFRTNSSTCLTFLTTKRTLKKTKSVFLSYCKWNYDYCLWISLTKYNTFNIFHKENFLLLLRAYYYGFFTILFWKKYSLYTPIPSLATHLESTWISPVIDWKIYFDTIK